ncbi:MAG: TetR/AcrR family transcriptional regulator [Candidatus Binatia bacterium]
MPRKTDARQRAVRTAARLFQRQGYHGTGLAQILEESGAPRGSFYHHFPGGKEQLAIEAIEEASHGVEALFAAASRRANVPSVFLRKLTRGLASWIKRSGFAEGSPVAILTAEATPGTPALREACQRCYRNWRDLARGALERSGMDSDRAHRLAVLIVSGLEGALLMSMAELSVEPLATLGLELGQHLDLALGRRRRPRL